MTSSGKSRMARTGTSPNGTSPCFAGEPLRVKANDRTREEGPACPRRRLAPVSSLCSYRKPAVAGTQPLRASCTGTASRLLPLFSAFGGPAREHSIAVPCIESNGFYGAGKTGRSEDMKDQSPPNGSTALPKSIYQPGMSLDDLARAYARACAIPEAEIDEFLAPEPKLHPELAGRQEFRKAAVCIEEALDRRKPILIFGDADVDGMTASVQMYDYLLAQGHPEELVRLFVPDRQRFGYGLTPRSLEHVLAQFKPQIVIALDCGSAAVAEVQSLISRGIEVLVVDHHPPEAQTSPTAHLNPRAAAELKHLELLCTAGLVFFLCDALNARRPTKRWDRKRSLILAGLGTVLDCVPLLRQNRALVKWALRHCNDGSLETSCPGLQRLQFAIRQAKKRFDPRVTVDSLSYAWGPSLNAAGRIGPGENGIGPWNRDQALLLLQERCSSDRTAGYARGCVAANEERRLLMEQEHQKVQHLAKRIMDQEPKPTVLLIAEDTILAGLAGPLAARLMETHQRPAIVCGLDGHGIWRGSGRAPAGHDLGRILHEGMRHG